MKVLTAREMKTIDGVTIEEFGLPGPVLMENAGRQIFLALIQRFPKLEKEKFVIVAGKGNNGGDGLVVARYLHNYGCLPKVFLLSSKEEVKGDAAINLMVAEKMGLAIVELKEAKDWKTFRRAIEEASVIIDAIFGTGLEKPASGFYARAIELINQSQAFKVAVDIPSGISSETPRLLGPAVKANLTITLGAPKLAHALPPAEEWMGEVWVADIGIPKSLFASDDLKVEWPEKELILSCFQPRKKDTHKGTYGHLLILAGSVGKTGAAVMAARAALKAGAGLVTVATPKSCLPVIARSTMEIMTEPLPETAEGTLAREGSVRLEELLRGKDAFLLGPGISTHPETVDLVSRVIPGIKIPVIIDADGLNILAQKSELLSKLPWPCVLTPHPGEFSRLMGRPTADILGDRLSFAQDFAEKYRLILVLKGFRSLVCSPDRRVFINPTGNPGMATGGSGDVLSGLVASLLVQFPDPLLATTAAVYVHGLSGDLASRKLGERSLVAGDLIRFLPQAVKALETEARSGQDLAFRWPGLTPLG